MFDDAREPWTIYKPRFERFIKTQGYSESEYADVLIMHLCSTTYQKLELEIYPKEVSWLNTGEIVAALDKVYKVVQPNVYLKRSKFRTLRQTEHQTIHEFVTSLKTAARSCKWNAEALKENLIEAFQRGLRDPLTRQRVTQNISQFTSIEEASQHAEQFDVDVRGAIKQELLLGFNHRDRLTILHEDKPLEKEPITNQFHIGQHVAIRLYMD